MPLASTGKALGMVTKLLQEQVGVRTSVTTTVGRPEPSGNGGEPRLNLFLYEAVFDPTLKNVNLDAGRQPPLWMVLKYLITGYDGAGETDTIDAQETLGLGLRALQELSYLGLHPSLPTDVVESLRDNPEVLKITFDEASADLIARLMQGPDEKYRFSMAFQVRPVMIATGEPPDFSYVVGVDETRDPPRETGHAGVRVPVLPSTGPSISELEPRRFETADALVVFGEGLNVDGLRLRIGEAEVPLTMQRLDRVGAALGPLAAGDRISAGAHPVAVVRERAGRVRSSNLLVGSLLPTVTGVEAVDLESHHPPGQDVHVHGVARLTGVLLGRGTDDVTVALVRDGAVQLALDDGFGHSPDQATMEFTIPEGEALPEGPCRVILRVNGEQAKRSPVLELTT